MDLRRLMRPLSLLLLLVAYMMSSAVPLAASPPHRGRLQMQGSSPRVEKSDAWAESTPLRASDGLARLDRLWRSLSPSEQRDRQRAYEDARRWIEGASRAGGVAAPVAKTFQDPQRKDKTARVDIEVIAGRAFVP